MVMTTGSAPEPQTVADSEGLARPQSVMVKVWGVQMVTPEKLVMNPLMANPVCLDPSKVRLRLQEVLGSASIKSVMAPVHSASGAP